MTEGITRRRLRVYVAGPISTGDVFENVIRALRWGKTMVKDGLAPYVPHFDAYMFGSGVDERSTGNITWNQYLEWDLEWVLVSDAVFRLRGASKGGDLEVARAQAEGIPVFFEEEYNALREYAAMQGLSGVRVG